MSPEPAGEHAAGGGKPPNSWIPTGKDGVVLLLLLGGTVGGYKLVDTKVETKVEEKATAGIDRSAELSARMVDLAKKIEQLDAALGALQSDRLRDLRTVFERGGSIQGALESMARQIADMKNSIDAVERRSQDADRDLKQQMSELRGEVNNALRAPLVGPRGR